MAAVSIHPRAPGPRGRLLLGCLSEFRRDPIGLMLRSADRYGDIVRLQIGPVLVHLINHPDYVEHVLVSNAHNYDKHTRSVAKIRATCGQSLLSTDGQLWRRHRQLIQPVFQPKSVGRYLEIIVDSTMRMLDRWSAAARSGRRLEIVSEMMQVTLEIAARSLFGAEIEPDARIVESSLAVILSDTWRRLQSWVDPASISPALHRRAFRRARQSIDEVVYRIIRTRRNQADESDDLLSLLIRARDDDQDTRFTDQELRDACITLLLAGHETTANSLAWSCLLVSQAPKVDEQIRCEVNAVLQDHRPELSDFEQLRYTRNVFAEAIRLYPPIWIMERRVVADDEIGGYVLPADSTLLISPYLLHRHPEFWADPMTFEPARFEFADSQAHPAYAYLPFGAGPHQCVGRHMATLVGRLILAMVYHRFRLQTVSQPQLEPQPGITLRHAQRLEMTVVERKARVSR